MTKSILYLILLFLFVSCNTEPNFLDKIDLIDLDEKAVDKSTLEGKVVILNFWATWCKPCVVEMPDLEKMQAQLSDDFVLILVSDEEMDRIIKFQESKSFELKFLKTTSSMQSLGIYSLPTTFIISQKGVLVETIVGAQQWDSPDQISKLKSYLE